MKKTLLIAFFATATITGYAQLNVVKNNHVEIGTAKSAIISPVLPSQEKIVGGTPTIPTPTVQTDSLATLSLLGTGNLNRGAYITFAGGNSVSIGDWYPTSSSTEGILRLTGQNGIRYMAGANQTIAAYTRSTTTSTPFYFYCPLVANGVAVSSDSRLKKDVRATDGEYMKLLDLNAVSYTLKAQPPVESDTEALKASEANTYQVDSRTRYGYIAQEVREIFPDLVLEDENGYLSVDYIGLIPLLVDAVKNLSAKVECLEGGGFNEAPATRMAAAAGIDASGVSVNSLSQNRPNPFTSATTIDCTLQENVGEASIGIYDLQGKQVTRLEVEGRGKTSVQVDGSTLAPGIYIYILMADGKEVATRRMILTD